jgi:hypothetical protein
MSGAHIPLWKREPSWRPVLVPPGPAPIPGSLRSLHFVKGLPRPEDGSARALREVDSGVFNDECRSGRRARLLALGGVSDP